MKQWLLEKQGQLRLFLSIIIILTTATAHTEDKIKSNTNEQGEKVYTNEKQIKQPQQQQPQINYIPQISVSQIAQQKAEAIKKLEEQQKLQIQQNQEQIQEQTNFQQQKTKKTVENVFATLTMFALMMFLIPLAYLILWLTALIDILKNEFTGNNKLIWVLIITFIPLAGPVLYMSIGKKQKISYMNTQETETPTTRQYTRPKI